MTLALSIAACLLGFHVVAPQALGTADGTVTLTVHTDQEIAKVSPLLYGIFFEEINYAGDGGLYAEMVRNRGFEDGTPLAHWSVRLGNGAQGTTSISESVPLSANSPKSLKVVLTNPGSGLLAVTNEGYWGMNVQAGEQYRLSLYARSTDGFPHTIEAALQSTNGTILGSATVSGVGPSWGKLETTLTASRSDPAAQLVLKFRDAGTVYIDHISLFPVKTWKNRPNGLRPDLAEMLVGLKPAFVRFPGGCWVEGNTMATAYRWKTTIGDTTNRATMPNLWGYDSTNGLGYHEYLQLCEDLGAEPLFVINCGMSHNEVVPLALMGEYVQDALDAIEYANGSVDSTWGAARAQAGHPEPFGLRYVEIGNENGGSDYNARYALFANAIKAKYPDVTLIANVWGGVPTSAPVEVVDEHYYNSSQFFIDNARRYDGYNRSGPKVYVGEYAVTSGGGNGNLIAALGEAAFMTGMERNADMVMMSSYAPLFANVSGKAWSPDLIYFDTHRVAGTPSYYVQKLFSENRCDAVVRSNFELAGKGVAFEPGRVGVGTWNTQAEFKDVKVVKGTTTLFESSNGAGYKWESGSWQIVNGALRQTSSATPARATFGDSTWTDYTLTLKARKLSGAEGFLITVGHRDVGNYYWWTLGGWNNTLDAIEKGVNGVKSFVGRQTPGYIEANRWYSIRIDYTKTRIRCYLDGKLNFDEPFPANLPLHAVAGTAGYDTVIKVVNTSESARDVLVSMVGGATGSATLGTATTLTGDSMAAENTLDNPTLISPTSRHVAMGGKGFRYRFPARSVTVLRWRSASPKVRPILR